MASKHIAIVVSVLVCKINISLMYLFSDWCGICNGDNSTCQMRSGTLEDVQPWGYSDILVIPDGAARIEIHQKSYHNSPNDDNYLGILPFYCSRF